MIRRTWFAVAAIALLIVLALSARGVAVPPGSGPSSASAPASAPAVFTFAVCTDTHIGSPEALARFRSFVHTLGQQKVDFLLVLGDMSSHAPEYIAQIKDILDRAPLEVHTIPGNHDDNYGLNTDWYESVFGKPYSFFDHKGYRFILCGTQCQQPVWLRKALAEADGWPVVLCQHYPMAAQEGEQEEPWAAARDYPNVRLALVGHMHTFGQRRVGTMDYYVLDKWFDGGPGPRAGSYYLVDAFAGGRTELRPQRMSDLKLTPPADALPTVTLASPGNGDILRGTVRLSGSADDDQAVAKAEYSVDFGPWRPADGTTTWQAAMDTSQLTDAHHVIRVRSVDSAGQAAIELPQAIVLVENRPGRQPNVFRFQQGIDGYAGCTDVTVRKHMDPKDPSGADGRADDLECWLTGAGGKTEFSEFYIRFDLAGANIPADKIKSVRLVLFGSRQNGINSTLRPCQAMVGVMREGPTPEMTFQTRPAAPAWLAEAQPKEEPALTFVWPSLGGRQLLIPPQPVVIDLTDLKPRIQEWLKTPSSNHGLVVSPAAGENYNMSARSSRYAIATLHPRLEIEVAP